MIRYDIDFAELEQAVDTESPTWRRRAAAANAKIWASKPRCFDDSGPSWSEIKHLYFARQNNKCAYCERPLDGASEQDVEHYRPKRAVTPWSEGVADGNPRGYCMLGYELRNYCIACKTCNSSRKRDHFPIGGRRGRTDARDLAELNRREQPMIPYPLGRIDDDPEEIIGFFGFLPIPRARSGHRHQRARVTIELFALDQRTELTRGRSMTLRFLWVLLETLANPNESEDERVLVRQQIQDLTFGHQPHTSCARAFVRLFEENPGAARAVYKQACELLSRTS